MPALHGSEDDFLIRSAMPEVMASRVGTFRKVQDENTR